MQSLCSRFLFWAETSQGATLSGTAIQTVSENNPGFCGIWHDRLSAPVSEVIRITLTRLYGLKEFRGAPRFLPVLHGLKKVGVRGLTKLARARHGLQKVALVYGLRKLPDAD